MHNSSLWFVLNRIVLADMHANDRGVRGHGKMSAIFGEADASIRDHSPTMRCGTTLAALFSGEACVHALGLEPTSRTMYRIVVESSSLELIHG